MNFRKLAEPFVASDIEWRVQQSGVKNGKGWAMVLAYVTNRAIQNRLDEAVGPENWKNEFTTAPDGGVLCGISIKCDGEWVTKWDGAENTQVEAVKGGLSGAMKRAAVQWGIGRYLYELETTFVEVKDKGDNWISIKKDDGNKVVGYWDAPRLPEWALPKPEPVQKPVEAPASAKPGLINPESRKTLYALLKARNLTGEKATEFVQFTIDKEAPESEADVQSLIAALKL